MSYRKPMLISLVLHALPLLFLISFADSKEGGGGDSDKVGLESGTVKVTLLDKNSGVGKEPCPNWYGGIGVTTARSHVQSVAKGHIAERSGIQVGDQILTPIETIKGEVGTRVKIKLLRDSTIIELDLVREKICTLGK